MKIYDIPIKVYSIKQKKRKMKKLLEYYYLPYNVNVVLKCGIISSSNNDEVKTTYYLVYDST